MRILHARCIALLALLGSGLACDTPSTRQGEPPSAADQLARELAAAHFAKDSRNAAYEAIAPLVEREDAAQSDLVDAACIQLRNGDVESARKLLARAQELGENDARLQYNLGRLAQYDTDYAKAAQHYRKVLALAPNDLPTRFKLVDCLQDSDPVEYERLLREVVVAGLDNAGSWYLPAIYKLGLHLVRTERVEEGEKLLTERQQLDNRKVPAPKEPDFDMGNFGRIPFPHPRGSSVRGKLAPPTFEEARTILPEFAGARELAASDLDDDGDLDLVAWGERGAWIGLHGGDFTWAARRLHEGPVDAVVALDLDNDEKDSVIDFVIASGTKLQLVRGSRGADGAVSWTPSSKAMPALAGTPSDALAIDYDHEGDLDLVFVGEFGVALLRNDGAASDDPAGVFKDVTREAGLPAGRAFRWCIAEDFDTDQDADLWFVGADGSFLATNERGGKFSDASAQLADFRPGEAKPIVADFDGDGRPDIWSSSGQLLRAQLSGRWSVDASYALPDLPQLAARGGGEFSGVRKVFALDLDLDGGLDLAWVRPSPEGQELRVQCDVALAAKVGFATTLAMPAPPLLIEDLDGDLAWDALAIGEKGASVRRGVRGPNGAVRLGFRGRKDNVRGVGAVVELRAGETYRRVFWRGEPTLFGVGEQSETDLVRITWPNGVVQYELRRDLGDRAATKLLRQDDGLVGSCPFLYAWNGNEFEFVSDVLGITPLGLPMAPGMLVPPDHDEYVLVRGDQLAPRDGVLELQFTEELREVTYLDRIRLDVVDHPASVEIYPNELFTFPPFPQAHTHTVEAPLAPKATGSDGADWSRALAAIDDDYAAPFSPAPGQFLGLATPHFLELEFDRERVASAKKLRLLMTGWFYWTDASVNMAAARDPLQEFVPPLLQVPDGAGGWKPAGPPIGFPAGKTKSMLIDVAAILDRADPRLRVFSTLRLYWDSIRLCVDGDDAPLRTTSLEPESAKLWSRGFSDPIRSDKPHQPERFDWERVAWIPRWDQHPGSYTKLGETLPLVTAIDDRFVILGAGDALTVRFDATRLPPLAPGWTRDYLVFLDGWAKDRDPNTVDALFVEPLPFHGMSGYPYGPGEHFPDDAEHRAWRNEWNTRPAKRWLPELAGGAELPRLQP